VSVDGLVSYGAEFSEDRVYRFKLWRTWDAGPMLMVIGLNPSTADETQDDPTVRRCIGFAKRWGFGGLMMMNAFAFRATDPSEMKAAPDAFWIENLTKIRTAAKLTIRCDGAVLAAWGNHGSYRERSIAVTHALADATFGQGMATGVACLGRTKIGEPKHPLYLANDTRPIPFIGNGGRLCAEAKK
jgi:hypothetical protein